MSSNKYFSHARIALKHGLKNLGLKKNDIILIPHFICDVVLHPIRQLNLIFKFYNLDEKLNPVWPHLNSLLNKDVKAILMVHYFGQPQNIKKFKNFCNNNNLFLIEDNAHGYGGEYNNKKLGTFGDIGISSPRKSFNICSGGVLFSKRPIIFTDPLKEYKVKFSKIFINKIGQNFPYLKFYLKIILKKQPLYHDPFAGREAEVEDLLIDKYSLKYLNKVNLQSHISYRRDAYKKWEKFAKNNDLEPIFESLSIGANPWCFPAYTKNSENAKKWYDWGWKNSNVVFSWPSLPKHIILKDKVAFNRWKRLICFSTESQPKI